MKLSADQANRVFDILVEKGNFGSSFGSKDDNYIAYKREEFVQYLADGTNEYWYSSACGSSIKVYFDQFSTNRPIWLYAQTYNPSKEATLVADVNAALEDFVAEESAI